MRGLGFYSWSLRRRSELSHVSAINRPSRLDDETCGGQVAIEKSNIWQSSSTSVLAGAERATYAANPTGAVPRPMKPYRFALE